MGILDQYIKKAQQTEQDFYYLVGFRDIDIPPMPWTNFIVKATPSIRLKQIVRSPMFYTVDIAYATILKQTEDYLKFSIKEASGDITEYECMLNTTPMNLQEVEELLKKKAIIFIDWNGEAIDNPVVQKYSKPSLNDKDKLLEQLYDLERSNDPPRKEKIKQLKDELKNIDPKADFFSYYATKLAIKKKADQIPETVDDIAAFSLMYDVNHIAWIFKDGRLYYMQSNPEIRFDHADLARKYNINFNHEYDPAGRVSSDGKLVGTWFDSQEAKTSPYSDSITALFNNDLIGLASTIEFMDGKRINTTQFFKAILTTQNENVFNVYSQTEEEDENYDPANDIPEEFRFKHPGDVKRPFSDTYTALIKLHELWYKINQLETKLSGRADDIKNRLIGEFYDLSQQVIYWLQYQFHRWLFEHKFFYTDRIFQGMYQMYNKLKSIEGSMNINEVMSTISLALNTEHYSGRMREYFGINREQLEELSNLDTSQWDEELKHVASKDV